MIRLQAPDCWLNYFATLQAAALGGAQTLELALWSIVILGLFASTLFLVSSDSDVADLATRAQEAGLLVYGFGVRRTMAAFVAACDAFVFVDEMECAQNAMRDEYDFSDGKRGAVLTPR